LKKKARKVMDHFRHAGMGLHVVIRKKGHPAGCP
jgi:hypothetical protein